jgi:hypothetical protein
VKKVVTFYLDAPLAFMLPTKVLRDAIQSIDATIKLYPICGKELNLGEGFAAAK